MSLHGMYEQRIETIVSSDTIYWAKMHYCYRPDDDHIHDDNQRYTFVGWQSENNFNNNVVNPPVYDLSTEKIYSDMNLFASYKIERADLNITDLQYFQISNGTISMKNIYKSIISGKITLPSTEANGNYINIINASGFAQTENITHVFFMPDAMYTELRDSAFESCSKLKNIYLNEHIHLLSL